MHSKHHRKESKATVLGMPKYYTSYEKVRPPRCPTCDRRYGIYGVIDSFMPYFKCLYGRSGENCWAPGYGWDGDIKGLKRWKGCVSRSHPIASRPVPPNDVSGRLYPPDLPVIAFC